VTEIAILMLVFIFMDEIRLIGDTLGMPLVIINLLLTIFIFLPFLILF